MNPIDTQLIRSSVLGTLALGALVFIPAGTFNYWQGWVYFATSIFASALYTIYLANTTTLFCNGAGRSARRTKRNQRKKSLCCLFLRRLSRSSFCPRSTIASAGRPSCGMFRSLATRLSRYPFIFSIACRR